ncbi:MAG TPA: tellurite resistance TerB family protein [Smithellaceae bacterium]|nr:tellurite resistance TerB family protein [Smithellaceae bacterium]
MNIGELLGAMVQTGMSRSSGERMKNSLGGGSVMDSLSGMMEKSAGQGSGGGIGDLLSSALGGSKSSGGGGIGDLLSGMLGGGRQNTGTAGTGGGIGDLLSSMLGGAGQAVGGNRNLAVGGLGALIGALLGGGGKSLKGAVGGGLMALLGAMALKALKESGQPNRQVPVGLLEPQTDTEKKELEQSSELILKAMMNAIKSDGQVDQNELDRFTSKFQELGVDGETQDYFINQLRQPMETETLVMAAQGQPQLAAQIYAASLLAIEVDTLEERDYLNKLAADMGLSPQVTGRIHEMVGLQPA